MSLPNRLSLNYAGIVRSFARISSLANVATYKNVFTVSSAVIPSDTLTVQTSSKGPASTPWLQKNAYNVNRKKSIIGSNGQVYPMSVSLTVTIPGGNVIDLPLEECLSDVLGFVLYLAEAGDPDAGSQTIDIPSEFDLAVRLQEI